MSKTFTVSMVIQGIDRVSGPIKGISASIRRMSLQAEKDTARASQRAVASRSRKGGEGGGVSGVVGGGVAKIASFVPQIAAATIGIGGLVEGYKKVTQAADDAASAQLKLTNAMMHVKGTSNADVAGVVDLAGELQKQTTYEDEVFMHAGAGLATFGMNAKQIKGMLPALADYLAKSKGVNATSEDGAAAAMLLGKAWSGNTGALRKQGIVLTAAQEQVLKHGTAAQKTAILVRAIESRMGGMAKQLGETPEGVRLRWEHQLGEVEEAAGRALMPLRIGALKLAAQVLPYLARFADALPKLLTKGIAFYKTAWTKIFGWVSEGFKGANVSGLLDSFKAIGSYLIEMFQPILPVFYKAIGQIGRWLIDLWSKSQPGLKAILGAISPIIDVLKNLWGKVLAPLVGWLASTVVPFLVNLLGPAFSAIVTVVAAIANDIIDLFGSLFSWFGKVGPVVKGFFVSLWGKLKVGWMVFKAAISDAWHGLFDGLFKWIEDKWKGFLDLLRGIGRYLGFDSGSDSKPTASQSSYRHQPPPLSGRLEMGVRPVDAREGVRSGKLDINITHDGFGKVKVKADDPLQFLRLGMYGAPL